MNETTETIINKRFAYRLGDKLPKPLKILYYFILTITLIYWLFRLIAAILALIQKCGAFVFEKRNFYTFVVCLIILAIGILLASQFIFNLDPFGKLINWFIEIWQTFKSWCIELIGG